MKAAGTKSVFIALFLTLGGLATAGSAFATDRHVETTGVDSGTCGALVDPCATIAQATINAAASGDRVLIGPGTFTQTAPIDPGAKSIEYVGSGPSSTTVTGGSSNSFPSAGLFAFRTTGATVAVRDLEVTGIPDSDATGSRFGIWIQPQPANPANAVNATIDNVRFTGVGTPPAGIFETAVYATNNNGSVTIQNCVANDLNGNMLLLESQQGAVSVSGSSFTRAASGGSTVIFDTMHDIGATNYDQTGLHSFTGNTFSSRSAAINVVGGWPFGASPTAGAFPVGVTISSNTIDTGSPGGTAVTLINAARDNTGTAGRIDNAVVSGNTITSGSGSGIVLQGGIPNAQITGNNVRNRTNGISLTRFTGGSTWDHKPDGATISANQIVDNTSGLTTDPGVAVTANANGNWWGCNAGPPVGSAPVAADCDSVSTFDASAISLTTWAVLDIAGSSNALASGGSDTVTAGFASDNLGGAAPAIFANGTVLPMSSTNGSLSDSNPTLSASTATSTFTSSSTTGRTATANFDHQSVTWAWQDVTPSPPVITITSPSNGAVVSSTAVTLTYTVNEPATCSPPSGTIVNLSVGVNTIFVTCTDAEGAVGTASVVVTRPDALPQCARDVVITNVQRSGSQSRISGIARLRYAGQRVNLQYEPSGNRTIARPVVQADGSWRATVHRPSNPPYTSNRARYRAILSKTTTSWIKLTRRMGATAISSVGDGRLKVSGRTSLPIVKGQPLRVLRSDSCGTYRQIGWLRVWGSGSFSGTVSDGGSSQAAVFVRLQLQVRSSASRTKFNTYSIVQPIVLQR